MPDLSIRDARPDDLDVIVDYNASLAQESEGKALDREVLTRGVAVALDDRDRLRYWVAETDDGSHGLRVVGQAAITREWSDWRAGWIWWFQSVYVHSDFRGQGTFRALYTHIRAMAREAPDVIGLRLYVEVNNDRAQRVYQSLGMKPGGYDVYEEMWIGPEGGD
jgi:ribosomal protein S18 acetylase RimI-like enzyme